MKTSIINGRPTVKISNANKATLEKVKRLLPEAEVNNLQALYPNCQIDATAEQVKLVKADVIIWQFPMNWYSFFALLKKWLDSVFSRSLVYGDDKLMGKKLILSFTIETPEETYQHGSAQNYPFTDLFNTHHQTVNHCRLLFQEPVISYRMKHIPEVMPKEILTTLQQRAKEHAAQSIVRIKELN